MSSECGLPPDEDASTIKLAQALLKEILSGDVEAVSLDSDKGVILVVVDELLLRHLRMWSAHRRGKH